MTCSDNETSLQHEICTPKRMIWSPWEESDKESHKEIPMTHINSIEGKQDLFFGAYNTG